MTAVEQLKSELKEHANVDRAKASLWYFKHEPGVKDIFLGVSVPLQRKIAHSFVALISPTHVEQLLHSNIHEERLTALLMWVEQYKKGDESMQTMIYKKYLDNTAWINNWDLVDTTARDIVGNYAYTHKSFIFPTLAKSKNIWERRIAIIATSYFIQQGEYAWTLQLAKQYLTDPHHYIHKSTGWMLREVGKKDESILTDFLDKYAVVMPRTMLRYAIEKLDSSTRKSYLAIKRTAVQ